MSMDNRKRAFVAVLAANIEGPTCQEITRFWEEKYASRPQFGISAFLDEVYNRYNISIKKGQLFRQLSRAIMQPDGVAPAGVSTSARTAAVEWIDHNGLKVFQALQDEFVALARPVDRVKITNAQYDGLQQQAGMDTPTVQLALKWLRGNRTTMPEQLELNLLKKYFNLGYVECCELYGPVKSDQMLNTALQKAGALPESHMVSPVQFI